MSDSKPRKAKQNQDCAGDVGILRAGPKSTAFRTITAATTVCAHLGLHRARLPAEPELRSGRVLNPSVGTGALLLIVEEELRQVLLLRGSLLAS